MKQIRFVEETNGQIMSNGIRNQRRDVYEDRIKYKPTHKEPKLFTVVHDHNKSIRKRGKLSKERVLELYPSAVGFDHVVKATNKVYRSHKLAGQNHKLTAKIGRGVN
jgi:hypothetical protein